MSSWTILFAQYRECVTKLWGGIIWWTAKEVDSDLLPVLIERFKPYARKTSYRAGAVIKQADWEVNIRRLCAGANITCTAEQIHFDLPEDDHPESAQ